MAEILMDVSLLAVIAGAILSFLAGWVWYGKLFRDKWAQGVGLNPAGPDNMPAFAMVMQFVGLFLLSWFVGVMAVHGLLLTTLLATFGFTALGLSGSAFRNNSRAAGYVDAGYWVLSVIIMVVMQGIF